jgi:putative heme-binding domain-containing protein
LANAASQSDKPPSEQFKLETLWVTESIRHVETKLLRELLEAKDPRVRAAAVRVLSHWHEAIPDGQKLLAKAVTDEYPRVRLEAIRALADYPSAEPEKLALLALKKPRDRFIDYALWLTTTELRSQWEPALEKGTLTLSGRGAAFALQAIGSKQALRPLLDEVKAGRIAPDDLASLLNLLATVGGPDDLAATVDLAVGNEVPAPTRVQVLDAMTRAAREKRTASQASLQKLSTLFDGELGLRVAAINLAGAAKVESLRPALEATASAKGAKPAVRRAAIAALGALGGKASIDSLKKLADSSHSQLVRFEAVAALVSLDEKAAANAATAALFGESLDTDPTAMFGAFVKHKGGDAALASALKGHKIPADAAKLGTRVLYQASRSDSPLLAALTEAGGIDAGPKELTKQQMSALVAEIAAKGDPKRGEAIFRRKEMACFQCHSIAGTGGIVAPDLLSIGASAPTDYLIDSILLPNKAVKEGYNSIIVTTKDGDQVTGIRVRQNYKELVLKDATRDEIVIPITNIKSSRDGGSIMPAGLAEQLTHKEFVDLVRFLSELGKGQYAAAGLPVARKWRIIDPAIPSAASATPANIAADTSITWRTEYSQVNGELPLTAYNVQSRPILQTQFTVSTGGPVALELNGADGIMIAYVDNKLVDAASLMKIDASPGLHSVTFVAEPARRAAGMRLELVDVPGSPAKAQFVGGK